MALTLPGATGRAAVRGRVRSDDRVVVLVFHGGAEHGEERVSWVSHAVLRMVPFANWTRAAGLRHQGIGVLRHKNAVRGWNGDAASPLADARASVAAVRVRAPRARIVLVGHSMGGRVALALAAEPGVSAVAALAPWVVETPPPTRARFLLMHGQRDHITDPRRTVALADTLRERGDRVELRLVPGENHAMLRRPWVWHRAVLDLTLAELSEA